MSKRLLSFLLLLIAVAGSARAQLQVEVSGVGSSQIPIAVASFARDGDAPQAVDAIVRADLQRSGLFRLVDPGATAVPDTATVDYPTWRGKGADAVVFGSMARLADSRFDLRFRLYDAVKQAQLDGLSYVSTAADLRLNAHRIADRIYEKLTGEPGVFATRIAYVTQLSKTSFELDVADADGASASAALRSREPIMSPRWSPDGSRLAYVSFESGKPVVYTHVVATGERRVLANFRGSNSSPAWAPDGRSLAVVLTRDGISQIYSINADGSGLSRLTRSDAIDTEPFYAPDGKSIYFTSDRGGGPQIYRMAPNGSNVQRVTFRGDYNVSPRVSPDGRLLAYVARRSGRFQVTTLDLSTNQELTLTDTVMDQSPSFAPNGRTLLYATEIGGRGILATVSTDGRVKTRLSAAGSVREPAWGPFIK